MRNVVVFGTSDSSRLAKYYIETDPKYADFKVVAFTVDSEFLVKGELEGVPVIDFAKVSEKFPPSENLLFIPITGIGMNRIRMERYFTGKKMGYHFFSYISSNATILTEEIGENCFILKGTLLPKWSVPLAEILFFSRPYVRK